jgi:hypothetical protein
MEVERRRASPEPTGGIRIDALKAAAMVGGAMAAGAGMVLETKALARRNGLRNASRVNAPLAAAMTACEVEHRAQDPEARNRPPHPAASRH